MKITHRNISDSHNCIDNRVIQSIIGEPGSVSAGVVGLGAVGRVAGFHSQPRIYIEQQILNTFNPFRLIPIQILSPRLDANPLQLHKHVFQCLPQSKNTVG